MTLIAAHYLDVCSGFDTDGDGLSDNDEGLQGSNPNNPDTDGDGLPDGVEVFAYGSNPTNADSDGDNYTDGEEAALGKTPTVFCKVMRADLDKDHVVTILDLSHDGVCLPDDDGQPGIPPEGRLRPRRSDHDPRPELPGVGVSAERRGLPVAARRLLDHDRRDELGSSLFRSLAQR